MSNESKHPQNFSFAKFKVIQSCILELAVELRFKDLLTIFANLLSMRVLGSLFLSESLQFRQIQCLHIFGTNIDHFLEQVLFNCLGFGSH